MPGDRFPIDSVVHGEYMKWSIVEARVQENPWNLWEKAMDEGTRICLVGFWHGGFATFSCSMSCS